MILASHGIIASQIASFDADAVAFFARVTAAGGTLSATEKIATNQLVLDLKANSLWTPMKAIYPMVGASAAACAQNLKSSSFTGTFTSGWTFASTGVTGNGTSAYMNTGLVESTNLSLNNEHISVYSRTNSDGGFIEIGTAGATFTPETDMFIRFSNLAYVRIQGTSGSVASNTDSTGFYVGNRVNSTQVSLFKNSTKSTVSSASVSRSPNTFYVGAINDNGVGNYYSNRQIAFISIGDGLTDTQASNFYTAVQAFQTTLSRQV